MMTGQTPPSAKLSCSLSTIALVALSMTFGGSTVRAQSDTPAPSWRELILDPIMDAMHTVEQRLASLEASVALFAGSFTTQQLTTRQLCVSDESGAQTCITKAELDALLGKVAHAAAEAPAAVIEPLVGITEAVPAATEAPAEIIEAPAAGIKAEAAAVVAPAAIETTTLGSAPAIELPVIVTIASPPAVADSAEAEAIIETAPAPVLMPKEAIPGDNALRDEEPAQTGSVVTALSRDALVSYPEVEISIPAPAASSD